MGMVNAAGREVPNFIAGYGTVKPYMGARYYRGAARTVCLNRQVNRPARQDKRLDSILEAVRLSGLKDGMTVSFHHHLRNGDRVVVQVMEAIHSLGIRDLHLAASGLFACQDALAPMIEDGTITRISVSTFGPGEIAKAISHGKLKHPAVMYTHGGRSRAIEAGELHIDVAFIAAPACDCRGNLNGSHGKSACGCLSYAYADAAYADCVVAVTDNLVGYPCVPAEIHEDLVDYVVTVDSLGDPAGIVSGAMKVTQDPRQLEIAQVTAELLDRAGYLREGMSFQTGIGSISLAVASKVGDIMRAKGIRGSFGSGGISGYMADMLEEGLFRSLWDVQCFDLRAVENLRDDPRHLIMSGSQYANPENKGCVVDRLDIVILGALEVDTDFNLNVTTGSDGTIRSASGGNADTAAGSRISLVVSSLMKKGGRSLVRGWVTTVTTPGETVDCVVTDYGIAINPRRMDLLEALRGSGLNLVPIERLHEIALGLGAVEETPVVGDRIVGIVEYRDGSVIDVVRQNG